MSSSFPQEEILNELREYIFPNDPNEHLCDKLRENDIKGVKLLLKLKANVNNYDYEDTKTTPLMIACGMGSPSIVELLLKNKAHADSIDANGDTALYYLMAPDISSNIAKMDLKLQDEKIKEREKCAFLLFEHGLKR